MDAESALRPVRQIAAHELVLDQIRRSLDIGQFQPGDRLPVERDLAEMLDVSRTVVRAAVAVLEREGRISVRRGRGGGFTVLEPPFDPAEARRQLRRNRAALRDAFDYRLVVETGAARLAAERRRVADLSKLQEFVERMNAITADACVDAGSAQVAEFRSLDSAFHLGIAYAARNRLLTDAVAEARHAVWAPVGAIFGRVDAKANDHHEEILEAIREKSPELAAAKMTEHIEDTRETIESWLRR